MFFYILFVNRTFTLFFDKIIWVIYYIIIFLVNYFQMRLCFLKIVFFTPCTTYANYLKIYIKLSINSNYLCNQLFRFIFGLLITHWILYFKSSTTYKYIDISFVTFLIIITYIKICTYYYFKLDLSIGSWMLRFYFVHYNN